VRSFLPSLLTLLLVLTGCAPNGGVQTADKGETKTRPRLPADDESTAQREAMVDLIAGRSEVYRGPDGPVARKVSKRVLEALRRVPRHELVPEGRRSLAYADSPLPIGNDQTISQPYIVALMTELLALEEGDKVLEVGTGSGYQAAVLAELAREVATIEIIPELAARAEKDLRRLGYENISFRTGDGYRGWPEKAPFDAIIVTAAPGHVPEPLKEQLAVGGRLVLPVGEQYQVLLLIRRTRTGYETSEITGVRFVPMTGEARKR
jgi:protein-L-isoaspartate(D-aspartate) O-methyltransferase